MNPIKTSSTRNFPHISAELLAALESRWPDRCPDGLATTVDEFRFRQGELAVVRFLRRQFDLQNATVIQHQGT